MEVKRAHAVMMESAEIQNRSAELSGNILRIFAKPGAGSLSAVCLCGADASLPHISNTSVPRPTNHGFRRRRDRRAVCLDRHQRGAGQGARAQQEKVQGPRRRDCRGMDVCNCRLRCCALWRQLRSLLRAIASALAQAPRASSPFFSTIYPVLLPPSRRPASMAAATSRSASC
jgi:hypothetical protein